MREIIIGSNEANQRFDKFLQKYLNNAGASFVYKMLRKKNITLNGHKDDGRTKLAEGDRVNIYISEESLANLIKDVSLNKISDKKAVMLDIIYECDDFLILNKPVGMLSQKAKKEDISANEYILDYLIKSGKLMENSLNTFKPSVCNRLDRNTSGILVFGKTLKGLQEISKAFKERTNDKYYLCVVNGVVTHSEKTDAYLKKDEKTNKVSLSNEPAKDYEHIVTEYKPISTNGQITLLKVGLITGKTHQIRAHLSFMGHGIIGDYKYGNRKVNDYFKNKYNVESQLLHAYMLRMGDKTYVADLPKLFENVLAKEKLCFPK